MIEIINNANYKSYFMVKLCVYTHTVKCTCIIFLFKKNILLILFREKKGRERER